ncbi:MAG: ABC transporter permease [Deltaproteobacteria bacterium]|nr:ABC transporter permease [Deltaproteobacteria bacterium]
MTHTRARWWQHPAGVVGVGLLCTYVALAVLGPWLAPASPTALNLGRALAPPGGAALLGTDENGIDLLSMLLHGMRLSLWIATCTTIISVLVGATLGAWVGLRGGWLDEGAMRVVDVLLAFPGIILNLALVALMARPGVPHLIFALSLTGWVSYARVARGEALALRQKEFVLASRLAGAGEAWLLGRHILPNLMSTLVVQATYGFASVMLAEASLSFLGLGPQLPYTLGALLAQGTTYLWSSSHISVAPGLTLGVIVLACNLTGDVLRDHWQPRRPSRLA